MKDFCGTGDGVLTAVAVSGLIKHKRLSLLADAKLYPQVNLDMVVADKMMVINHEELWKTAAEIGRETGGRMLVRASGTEPKIRIMAECLGEEKCRAAAERRRKFRLPRPARKSYINIFTANTTAQQRTAT